MLQVSLKIFEKFEKSHIYFNFFLGINGTCEDPLNRCTSKEYLEGKASYAGAARLVPVSGTSSSDDLFGYAAGSTVTVKDSFMEVACLVRALQ